MITYLDSRIRIRSLMTNLTHTDSLSISSQTHISTQTHVSTYRRIVCVCHECLNTHIPELLHEFYSAPTKIHSIIHRPSTPIYYAKTLRATPLQTEHRRGYTHDGEHPSRSLRHMPWRGSTVTCLNDCAAINLPQLLGKPPPTARDRYV